jgi:serine/threonine protein kinase
VAKLLDFGIVGTAAPAEGGPAAERRLALGTPAYMSPEQAAPGSDLDARSAGASSTGLERMAGFDL